MSITPRNPANVKSMLMTPMCSEKSSEPHTSAWNRVGWLLNNMLAPALRCSGPRLMSISILPWNSKNPCESM